MSRDTDVFLAKLACLLALVFVCGLMAGSLEVGHLLIFLAIMGGLSWFFSAFRD